LKEYFLKNIPKVLHIIASLGQGGAERQLIELVSENKNHAICQLISGGIYEEAIKKNKIILFNLGIKKNIFDIIALYKLYKIINNYKPDVIHTWMYHASLLEVILRKIINIDNVPLVWGMRCSDMKTLHYSNQLKIVIKACKYFSASPTIIVNNSKAGAEFHKSIGFKNKHITIHNGIDTNLFKPNNKLRLNFRKKYNIETNITVLLCVARYDPMKDHDTLLKAFIKLKKTHPEIILILAGAGTENIQKVEGIITLGSFNNINQVYAGSDIIISSSSFGEGFSNALGEGMASGLLPVATKVGDSEIILGDIGKVVKSNDENGLAIAIKDFLDLEENIYLITKKEARKRICNYFSKDIMLNSYAEMYSKLLQKE